MNLFALRASNELLQFSFAIGLVLGLLGFSEPKGRLGKLAIGSYSKPLELGWGTSVVTLWRNILVFSCFGPVGP